MATTRIIPIHKNKGKSIAQCLHDRTAYATNSEKTEGGELVSAFACDSRTADAEFLLSKREYRILTGRVQERDVIAYQVRQSFKPGEIAPEEANRVGYEFASRFLKENHAFIVATHVDRKHIHNHIIWNSTNLDCTRKFRNFIGSFRAVRRLSDTICFEHGLSIIEKPKGKGVHYGKWLGAAKEPTLREQLCAAIDAAIAQKPNDLEAFLSLMEDAGYTVKRGAHIAFSTKGHPKNIRLRSLGEGYSEEDVRDVLSGAKTHEPQKKRNPLAPEKNRLLIDIDAKMQEGKGAGYERWAKVFNLKQLAQTVNYLKEHNLLDYDELICKTDDATNRYYTLSGKIKGAEKRMAEIAVLKTHIQNYVKTKDVYTAYRKAGYSKKYLSQHEGEILLHKAAKKAFDEAGTVRLPTIKSLQTEYAGLLSEKKKDYSQYRAARDEMRELQIHKAKVDEILGETSKKDVKKREEKSH